MGDDVTRILIATTPLPGEPLPLVASAVPCHQCRGTGRYALLPYWRSGARARVCRWTRWRVAPRRRGGPTAPCDACNGRGTYTVWHDPRLTPAAQA